MPNPQDIAVLQVGGTNYKDWESVMVRHELRGSPPYVARFTASEGKPLSKNFLGMQVMPGQQCTITLGGLLAFTGKVVTRQAFYDKNRHYIEIQCANPMEILTSSVIHQKMSWENKPAEPIAREVLSSIGQTLVVEGGSIPATPIERVAASPGQSVHDFLDELFRHVGQQTGIGISFTSNNAGQFVVIVGPTGGADTVVEGQNILEGREIIYSPAAASGIPASGQAPGTDQRHATKSASELFYMKEFQQFLNVSKPANLIYEWPAFNQQMLQGRATNEGNWFAEDEVTVFAVVRGWMRPSGGLWYRGQIVTVESPMLVMRGAELILRVVTFTQDNSTGTRTTLEMVNANALNKLIPQSASG